MNGNPNHKDKTMKIEQILLLFKKVKIKHEMFEKREKSEPKQYLFRPTLNEKSQ